MSRFSRKSAGRAPAPLDPARLEELALAYVARFATTRAKLEAYLVRKVRERGWSGAGEPPAQAIADRFAEAGYVDDAAYARMKTGSLLRRGYGMLRVGQALRAAGVEDEVREELAPAEAETRWAALALARKRRFGPFGGVALDRPMREKQLAAMLRAGHALDSAVRMVDAASVAEAEQWAAEASDE
ncbi:MAG TPA: RecX family transcriptional regulator [Novosphingobium sp.]|nr:RecX family transcriptional regulator [Novosphingobium sp.]